MPNVPDLKSNFDNAMVGSDKDLIDCVWSFTKHTGIDDPFSDEDCEILDDIIQKLAERGNGKAAEEVLDKVFKVTEKHLPRKAIPPVIENMKRHYPEILLAKVTEYGRNKNQGYPLDTAKKVLTFNEYGTVEWACGWQAMEKWRLKRRGENSFKNEFAIASIMFDFAPIGSPEQKTLWDYLNEQRKANIELGYNEPARDIARAMLKRGEEGSEDRKEIWNYLKQERDNFYEAHDIGEAIDVYPLNIYRDEQNFLSTEEKVENWDFYTKCMDYTLQTGDAIYGNIILGRFDEPPMFDCYMMASAELLWVAEKKKLFAALIAKPT